MFFPGVGGGGGGERGRERGGGWDFRGPFLRVVEIFRDFHKREKSNSLG